MKKIILTLSLALIATIGFSQNIYPETVDGKACLVKQNGKKVKVLVNENFEKYGAYNESANLIPAKLNGKWGFYDNDGKLVIPHIYEGLFASCNGNYCNGWYNQEKIKVFVKKEDSPNKPLFIDKTGKEVAASEYELVIETTHTGAGYFFKKDGKWALADKDKKVLTEFKYDKILGPIGINPFVFRATRDGQDYRLNTAGQEEAAIESNSNTNSGADKKEEKTKCTYKCRKCDKTAQGGCNASNNGILKENCTAQQPDPKGPRKNHEWFKQ